jgi:putative ATP-dependent endonuclease of the OLD family
LRGIDIYRTSHGQPSLLSAGVALADAGGGYPEKCFERGAALIKLGYQVIAFFDGDKPWDPAKLAAFHKAGGGYCTWEEGQALEDAIFLHLDDGGIDALIGKAIEFEGEQLIADHIRSYSNGQSTLFDIQVAALADGHSHQVRTLLGMAARKGKWFKTVTRYEAIGHDIVAPRLAQAKPLFQNVINNLFQWCLGA